jgi:hypothetical protein
VIKIEVIVKERSSGYRATFANDQQAFDFCSMRAATHVFRELEDHPLPEDCSPALYELLYPKCEHGLLAELCAGPQHYPYDEDELRGMGYLAR